MKCNSGRARERICIYEIRSRSSKIRWISVEASQRLRRRAFCGYNALAAYFPLPECPPMPLDLVQTLCDLVQRPSVNPMGRAVSGPEYFEYRMTEYLEDLF